MGLASLAVRSRLGVSDVNEAKKLKNAFWSELDDFALGLDVIRETRLKDKADSFTEISTQETTLKENLPSNVENVSITVANPVNLPQYLQQQNELLGALVETFKNNAVQSATRNELIVEQISALRQNAVHSEVLVETLHDLLSPISVQLQEISRIPSIMSLNSDIAVAYDELGLEHNESIRGYFQGLNDRIFIMENILGSMDINLKNVGDNAKSQKVIADYQQTEVDIRNLDGNIVTRAKPMEVKTQNDAVRAKNETDEMEFELEDEVLDGVFPDIQLPTFTKGDFKSDNDYVLNAINNMGVSNE